MKHENGKMNSENIHLNFFQLIFPPVHENTASLPLRCPSYTLQIKLYGKCETMLFPRGK